MTLTIKLTPDLEQRLADKAAQLGLTIGEYTVQVPEAHLPPAGRRQQAVAAIQSWIDEGDPDEQHETGGFLIQAMNEDRVGQRKLFPQELKGISW